MSWNTHIPKFRRFVLQNFPFIEQDFDALTDYQLICKIVEYLNKVIDSQNGVIDQITILTDAFNELRSYVEHYFDNLDVQDEINNKLDQMVESGVLTQLIAQYLTLNAIMSFPSVASMKAAENLVEGSTIETYGFYSTGDGGGAKYIIRTVTNEDTVDEMTIFALTNFPTLIAQLIIEPQMNVLQFGAKGDNSNDDTNFITTAIEHVDDLLIPKGIYLTTSTISLPQNKTIKGENTESSIIKYNGTGNALTIRYTGNGRTKILNLSILKNGGRDVDDETSAGIYVDKTVFVASNVVLDNVDVRYFYRAFYSPSGSIISSHFHNSRFMNSYYGFYIISSFAVSLHGCVVSGNHIGFYIRAGELEVNNTNITYNEAEGALINPVAGKFIFNQCFFETDDTSTTIGIRVRYDRSTYVENVKVLHVTGCHFYKMNYPLQISNTQYLTVDNCTFYNYGTAPIIDGYYVEQTDPNIRWYLTNNYYSSGLTPSEHSYFEVDDTGWVAIDTSATALGTWSEALYARRIGNVTYLKGKLGSLANTDTGSIGVALPKPFAPLQNELRVTIMSGSSWYGGIAYLNFASSYTSIIKMDGAAATNNTISFNGISWIN